MATSIKCVPRTWVLSDATEGDAKIDSSGSTSRISNPDVSVIWRMDSIAFALSTTACRSSDREARRLGISELVEDLAGGRIPGQIGGLPRINQCGALQRFCYRAALIVGRSTDLKSDLISPRVPRSGAS